jgi:polyisoprenoid-binding protein YceI
MPTQSIDTQVDLGVAVGTWTVDQASSELGFMVKTMWGLAPVKGRFGSYAGTLDVGPDGAAGQLTVDTASLDTGLKMRDKHLRSPDFFDVADQPTLTFTPSAITPAADGLTIIGDLTIGTATVRLELPVEVQRKDDGRLRLLATATVTREQAGMTWNRAGMIRGDAHLHAELELVPAV